MEKCRSASTPLSLGFQITWKNENCEKMNPFFGTHMFLVISTKPDIFHSVCKLAQQSQEPHIEYEKAAKHVLQYLDSTRVFLWVSLMSYTVFFLVGCDCS